ncbi:NAC domain-containing protein 26-like isoform X2 [Momordica charantia]|uniref:NAC domain-containing protein 26-like isoform X2 n=1 Tax=Momordica charantia TaxID=3673 RepID=A0A6J1CSX9_MOMCH|nr:NAC domain-containing protein 26-like isoform X2 [Momordica charantia]
MTPSTVASPAILDLFCADEEVFLAIRKISSGCPLPQNVYGGDIDPYRIKPSNLPGDIWYYVKCNGSTIGHWKRKGEDRKVYLNSPFTGWVTTYEFSEDQAAHEHKMVWVMEKYWMSGTDLCENSKQKETSSLCKVFLVYEQVQNHEKIQISDSDITSKSEAINPNHQLVVPDASNNMTNNGSTSKSKISGDDKMVELPVAGKPLDYHSEEMDYLSRGDFLELIDLDDPASPSSSSDSSSCLTMSSDEMFDAMALLQDLECDINPETIQRDAACIGSSVPSKLKKEVVHRRPSESFVIVKRSESPAEENPKTNSTVVVSSPPIEGLKEPDMKQLRSQSEKAGYGLEGASSSSSSLSKTVSNGQETAMDGGKKTSVGRVKKKKTSKKYLCFFPF